MPEAGKAQAAPDPENADESGVLGPAEGPAHAELLTLYAESTETIRFAKNHQWKTVGSTLLTDGALIAIAKLVAADAGSARLLFALVILLTTGAIYALVLYQIWQYNEFQKIAVIEPAMSEAFRTVRQVKSRIEADIQRYTLLAFMVTVVVFGAAVAYLGIERISAMG